MPDAFLSNRRHFECTNKHVRVLKINQTGGQQEANDRIRKLRSIGVYAQRLRLDNDYFQFNRAFIIHVVARLLFHCVVMVERVVWLEVVRIV